MQIGSTGGQGKKKGAQRKFEELMTLNLPNWMKNINIPFQTQSSPTKINSKRCTSRHITIKLSKPMTKRKSWRRSNLSHMRSSTSYLLMRNHGRQKAVGWRSLNAKRKRFSTNNSTFYIQHNYPSKYQEDFKTFLD